MADSNRENAANISRRAYLDNSHGYKSVYHTGIDINQDLVTNYYDGKVVLAHLGHTGYAVIVQTEMSFCVVYDHLKRMSVRPNEFITKGQEIGYADTYVHIELLKLEESAWPVRVGDITWYKTDPSPIFDTTVLSSANTTKFDTLGISEISEPTGAVQSPPIEGYMKYILSNNEGD